MYNDYAEILMLEDVCEVLRIGKNKAYEILHQNLLKGYREGRIWKVPRESIHEYIRSMQQRQLNM